MLEQKQSLHEQTGIENADGRGGSAAQGTRAAGQLAGDAHRSEAAQGHGEGSFANDQHPRTHSSTAARVSTYNTSNKKEMYKVDA